MKLTENEVHALNAIFEEAIVQSREHDGDPVFHEVEVNSVNPFVDESVLSEVYDSLSKNGLIQCSGLEQENGHEVMEFVCITPMGLEALKSVSGVH